MESHAVSSRLQENRERMRAVLLPDGADPGDAGSFPRSAVMRLVLNSRARGVAMSVLSVLLMLRGRRRPRRVPRPSLLPRLTRSIGGLIGARRH